MKAFLSTIIFSLLSCTILFAQPKKSPVKVACIGNSITYGAGIKDRAKDSYPIVLGKMLGEKYIVKNFGVSGRTMLNKGDRPYMKEEKFKEAIEFNPDIIIIKLGTNDSKPHNRIHLSEFKADAETLLQAFDTLSTKPIIYICYPAKVYSNESGIDDEVIVNEIIPIINQIAAEYKLKVIDLHTALSDMPQNFPDNIHPNEEGAKALAQEVYKAILNKE